MADSRVKLLGSNSFFCPAGDPDLDPGFLSLDCDRDRDMVPRRACFKDDPRGPEEEVVALVGGVDVECTNLSLSLDGVGVGSETVDAEDCVGVASLGRPDTS
jgi:hypothetical protein